MTITYRLDSNITQFYGLGHIRNVVESVKVDKKTLDYYKLAKSKSTSVAWIASNCYSAGRSEYIKKLGEFIKLQLFGNCPKHTKCGKTCYKDVAKNNKFYFAAENSLCKDYISEKPWRALEVGMIPVVYGYGNYSQVLPHNSFIDVRDFESPRLLATYLNKVANNKTLYNSYFKWRDTFVTSERKVDYICQLCELLNQPERPKRIVKNLDIFWSQGDCINPTIFHKSVMRTS